MPADLKKMWGVTGLRVATKDVQFEIVWVSGITPVFNPICFGNVEPYGDGCRVRAGFKLDESPLMRMGYVLVTAIGAMVFGGWDWLWLAAGGASVLIMFFIDSFQSDEPMRARLIEVLQHAAKESPRHERLRLLFLLATCVAAGRLTAQADTSTAITERTATAHPLHYFVSLPSGWNPQRTWPLLVVIPDADREFRKTATTFAAARGSRPFVIVVPMVLGGGGTAQQHKDNFDYPDSAWSIADRVGNCDFDEDGLTAALDDVGRLYHTDSKIFLTGWEAGGHVVIPQLLRHPERMRAVAVVTPNFLGRCVTSATRNLTDAESRIPVRVFGGDKDLAWTSTSPLFTQSTRFDRLARTRGFRNLSDSLIRNGSHGALATDVVGYFASLLTP